MRLILLNCSAYHCMKMESLQRSRKGHKSHITVLRNKLADILSRNDNCELKNLRESLTKAIEKVETLNEQITFIITEESDLIQEITQAGEYSFMIRADIHKLNEAITTLLPPALCPPVKSSGVKLPKLNI